MAQTPALHPAGGLRHSPVGGVVLTNADVDHVAGLLSLREGQALSLYATPRVHRVLAANPIFGVLNPQVVARLPLALEAETELMLPDGGRRWPRRHRCCSPRQGGALAGGRDAGRLRLSG